MIEVLIIKPSSLGDIVHAAPAVERIARSRADCRVTWLVNDEYSGFVRELPGVSGVLPFPRRRLRLRRLPLWPPPLLRWLGGLRRGFDVAIDLQGLQRSGFIARLSGARERFGPSDARELAWMHYNRPIDVPAGLRHAADRLDHVVTCVLSSSALIGGQRNGAAALERPPLRLPRRAEARIDVLLGGEPRPLVALCPGTRWPSKLWPGARWAELLMLLERRRPDLLPVFVGAPGEEPLAQEAIISARADGARTLAWDFVGKLSLWETACLLARAHAVVTVDSAPLHIAAYVGTPTISLFGPTDPARVAPRGSQHRVVQEELDCLACYRRRCPLPRRACLPDLHAERVLAALETFEECHA